MSVNQPVPTDEPSDEHLVARIQEQDIAAFSLLFDRYHQTVFAFASHLLAHQDTHCDAEEIVQDVFLRLWERAGQFDPARGSFRSWFMTMARNRIMDELKRNKRQLRVQNVEHIEAALLEASDGEHTVEEVVWRHARAQAVLQALRELPPEQRLALFLAYFGGLGQAEIAQELNLPLGTVKKRVRLGLQKLRRKLWGWDDSG